MKRVVIVHGWHGGPKDGWFPWLKENLESKGFEVISSQYPGEGNPKLSEWLEQIKIDSKKVDENLFFVGHSLGCVLIVRFLETLPENIKVGGAVFVAPFLKKLRFEEISKFTDTTLDIVKAKIHLSKNISIVSHDDHAVPFDIATDFINQMNSEIVIDDGKGHFGQKSGIKELPSALDAILKISK